MLTPPLFTKSGDWKDDFWLVNGSKDFSMMPATKDFPEPYPIRLHIGTPDYGSVHLEKHRHKWPKKMQEMLVVEILYEKLKGAGKIWLSESDSKVKVTLTISPSAILILTLKYMGSVKYWSVTSIYPFSKTPDGDVIGRYCGMKNKIQLKA